MKRIIALVLAVLMVAALFVGCQKNDPAPGGETGGESKPVETKKPGEIPTIEWVIVGGGSAPNQESWDAKVNAYLEEKIGVHLHFNIIPWADHGNRTNNMVATNEYFDIMFADFGSYRTRINMNAYMDITPYLDQVPALKETIPDALWEAATLNGGIYSVPTYKDVAAAIYWLVDTPVFDKNNMDPTKNYSAADMTPILQAYKDETGKMPIVTGGFNLIYPHYDGLALGIDAYGVDMYAEGAPKIVETYKDPWAVAEYDVLRGWIKDGLMNDDGAVRKDITDFDWIASHGQGWPSAWINGKKPTKTVPYARPFMNNGSCLGSLNAISSSSKYPVEALKVLELANTDTWFRDALCYGEEGVNFEYIEENGDKKVHKLNEDWGGANYTQAQFFIETPIEGTIGNPFVDEVLVNNENALVSPCIGFYADTTEIEDQLDEMRGIFREFQKLMNAGADMSVVQECYDRLNDVGAQDVIAELQRQLDEWWAAKNA